MADSAAERWKRCYWCRDVVPAGDHVTDDVHGHSFCSEECRSDYRNEVINP